MDNMYCGIVNNLLSTCGISYRLLLQNNLLNILIYHPRVNPSWPCCTYYTYVCTYLCTYVFDLLLVKCKWCVVLSIVMEHQFHYLCCLSLSTGGVHGHHDSHHQQPSHCSTDTSWAVWRERGAQKEGKVLYDYSPFLDVESDDVRHV